MQPPTKRICFFAEFVGFNITVGVMLPAHMQRSIAFYLRIRALSVARFTGPASLRAFLYVVNCAIIRKMKSYVTGKHCTKFVQKDNVCVGPRIFLSSNIAANLFTRINRYHQTSTPAPVNDFLFLTICCAVLQLFVIDVNMAMLSFARLLLSKRRRILIFWVCARRKNPPPPANVLKKGPFSRICD